MSNHPYLDVKQVSLRRCECEKEPTRSDLEAPKISLSNDLGEGHWHESSTYLKACKEYTCNQDYVDRLLFSCRDRFGQLTDRASVLLESEAALKSIIVRAQDGAVVILKPLMY